MPGVSRDVHDRVRELAVEEAYRRYGVTPGEHGVPVGLLAPRTWAELITEMWSKAQAGGDPLPNVTLTPGRG
jgi:hypothetical protein